MLANKLFGSLIWSHIEAKAFSGKLEGLWQAEQGGRPSHVQQHERGKMHDVGAWQAWRKAKAGATSSHRRLPG